MLEMLWEPSRLGENSCQLVSVVPEEAGAMPMLRKHTETMASEAERTQLQLVLRVKPVRSGTEENPSGQGRKGLVFSLAPFSFVLSFVCLFLHK